MCKRHALDYRSSRTAIITMII
jgi:hypothetical protein